VAVALMCSRFALSNQLKYSARTLLIYGLPALPLALLSGPAIASLPNYYVANIGMPLAAVGFALTAARIWDAVADPIVGIFGDRLRSRFGRRRPLMLAGIPLTLLGAWFTVANPQLLTPLTLMFASIVMFSGWTMIKLSHSAWGAELSTDYAERVRITAYREACGLIGGLVAIGLLAWGLIPGGVGLPTAYTAMFGVLAISLFLTIPLCLAKVPEPKPDERARLNWRQSLRVLRNNRALQKLSLAYVLNNLAGALPATLFQAFVIHALLRGDLQGPLILLYSIAAIVAVPFWNWAGKRYGKHIAWRYGIIAAAAFFAPAITFGEGDVIWYAAVCVLTGICFAADLVLPPAIQADVLDEDRLASGEDRAGLLFAWLGLLAKLADALAPGIAFPVLALVGFNAAAGSINNTNAILVLGVLYSVVPVVLKVCAWVSLRDFPIDAARQLEIRILLAERSV
jgi:glycoside/pentoside/hexuronide:cation symporter, GPH family